MANSKSDGATSYSLINGRGNKKLRSNKFKKGELTNLLIMLGMILILIVIAFFSYYAFSCASAVSLNKKWSNFRVKDETRWPIMQTLLINLNRSKHRLNAFSARAQDLELSFTRINAIDRVDILDKISHGLDISSLVDDRIKLDSKNISPTNKGTGLVACTLSHMTTLLNAMDAVKDGKALDGPILIFEDDVYLDNNFKSVTTKALSFMDENFPDWAIFGIGSCDSGRPARLMGFPVITNVEGFYCFHAYILKNSAAALKLFDAMNTTYVQIADLGWHYLATGRNPSLPAYIYLPNNVCHQNRQDHPSEISVS